LRDSRALALKRVHNHAVASEALAREPLHSSQHLHVCPGRYKEYGAAPVAVLPPKESLQEVLHVLHLPDRARTGLYEMVYHQPQVLGTETRPNLHGKLGQNYHADPISSRNQRACKLIGTCYQISPSGPVADRRKVLG